MRILVTGGAGFIGSHLSERLLEEQHEVIALDNLSTSNFENLKKLGQSSGFKFINGSVLDFDLLKELAKDCDYIFHLAAAVGVFNIVNNPLQSLLINIRGTENVLESAHAFGVPVFLTSSSEVYGKNTADSLAEGDDRILGSPTTLRWAYSEAKAIDESLAYAYFYEKKLQTRIVRFFNTVGPRQLGAYGMVVPRFIGAAIKNEPILIYGDGNQTRCFTHILDAIDAVIRIAFSPNTVGKVVNIGNNTEISILELAKKVISETNSKSEIIYLDYDKAYGPGYEDMRRRVPNINLAKELVGWSPNRNLSDIIRDISRSMLA